MRPPTEKKTTLPVQVKCPNCDRMFYRQESPDDPVVKQIVCRSTKCKDRPPFRYRVVGGRVQIV
ncbi:MAG: hypothetical protein AB7P40_16065 [Chloroflexota bacterium]